MKKLLLLVSLCAVVLVLSNVSFAQNQAAGPCTCCPLVAGMPASAHQAFPPSFDPQAYGFAEGLYAPQFKVTGPKVKYRNKTSYSYRGAKFTTKYPQAVSGSAGTGRNVNVFSVVAGQR